MVAVRTVGTARSPFNGVCTETIQFFGSDVFVAVIIKVNDKKTTSLDIATDSFEAMALTGCFYEFVECEVLDSHSESVAMRAITNHSQCGEVVGILWNGFAAFILFGSLVGSSPCSVLPGFGVCGVVVGEVKQFFIIHGVISYRFGVVYYGLVPIRLWRFRKSLTERP